VNRRTVANDFGHALHQLSRVVTHADYALRPNLSGMLEDALERVGTRILEQIGEECDVAADQSLQAGAVLPSTEREGTTIPLTIPKLRSTR
jgi:hypothetical protein